MNKDTDTADKLEEEKISEESALSASETTPQVIEEILPENASAEKVETKELPETEEEEEVEEVEMVEIPKKRLEELETAEERVLEEIKRERAESINARKRMTKQRDEFVEIASSKVLTKLLDVKDDLDRIIEKGKDEIPESHLTGIELLRQRVEGIFNSENVSLIQIEPNVTKYDPVKHEAVTSIINDDLPENIIIDTVNAGFIKGDRVLRVAKVVISKKSTPPSEDDDDDIEFTEF